MSITYELVVSGRNGVVGKSMDAEAMYEMVCDCNMIKAGQGNILEHIENLQAGRTCHLDTISGGYVAITARDYITAYEFSTLHAGMDVQVINTHRQGKVKWTDTMITGVQRVYVEIDGTSMYYGRQELRLV